MFHDHSGAEVPAGGEEDTRRSSHSRRDAVGPSEPVGRSEKEWRGRRERKPNDERHRHERRTRSGRVGPIMTDEINPRGRMIWMLRNNDIVSSSTVFRYLPDAVGRRGPIERVRRFVEAHTQTSGPPTISRCDTVWCVWCTVYKYTNIFTRVLGRRDAMPVSDGHACLHGSMRFRLCAGTASGRAPGPPPPIRSRLLLLLRNARRREFFPALARIVIRTAVSCHCLLYRGPAARR